MPTVSQAPSSGRYLSFAEREEIAILRARGCGVREIARQLGRSPSTISRELRNAATRSGRLEYRASTAQWHADRRARRPKRAKPGGGPRTARADQPPAGAGARGALMTALAPVLQAFFTERLLTQLNSSPETIAAYRDAFRLLLRFARQETGMQPFELDIDDLDAPLIGAFLTHLEADRGNRPPARNARLGAIHSFYRFAALSEASDNAAYLQ
jgi:Helix-turn-helix domain/Phage integrase, N-terminal SAM-like domain